MRATRTIRSTVTLLSLTSMLLAQTATTTLSPTIARRNDPPIISTVADVNGQATFLAVAFAPFGEMIQVAPIVALPDPAGTFSFLARPKARGKAQAAGRPDPDSFCRPDGGQGSSAIPPNGPGLNIPDPDEFGFDPWDIPDPPDPFDVPDPPSPFDDPNDPFGDPFGGLPEPPMDLPPLPGGDLPSGNFPENSVCEFNDDAVVVLGGGSSSGGHASTPSAVKTLTIPVGHNPAGMAVLPDHSGALVTNNGAGSISVIQGTAVVATIQLPGASPDGIAITPDGLHAYVTNFDDQTPAVYVIDIPSRQVIATLQAPGGFPPIVRITPDGSQAWVTSIYGNDVEIIDTATNTILRNLSGFPGAWGLTFDPTGTRAYVAASTAGELFVIDMASYKTIAAIPVGPSPRHPISSGRFVFVSDSEADYVTQIDAATNTVVRTITVGPGATTLTFVPNN